MLDSDRVSYATKLALAHLREPTGFQWNIVVILVLVGFIYSNEIQAKRWNAVAAGLAFWFADLINELLNSAVLHVTGVAPLWAETGTSSFQILVGLNIESAFLFLIYGIVYAKMLPADREQRILGIDARYGLALGMSGCLVALDLILNSIGVLHWYWPFWNRPWGLPLILIFGYLWLFLAAAWAHDAPENLRHGRRVLVLGATAAALGEAFWVMGWL